MSYVQHAKTMRKINSFWSFVRSIMITTDQVQPSTGCISSNFSNPGCQKVAETENKMVAAAVTMQLIGADC